MASHLLTQGKKAFGASDRTAAGMCLYRHGKLACAAGCLISDEFYKPQLEGMAANAAPVMEAISRSGWDPRTPSGWLFIDAMQAIHDNCKPCDWASRLRVLAVEYNLDSAVVHNHKTLAGGAG